MFVLNRWVAPREVFSISPLFPLTAVRQSKYRNFKRNTTALLSVFLECNEGEVS